MAKHNLADYTGVIKDYDKVIQMNSADARFYFFRGSSKYGLNDKAGACLDWAKAKKLEYKEAAKNIKRYCL